MSKLTNADAVLLLEAWDRLDRAIQQTIVAQPSQMTGAAQRMDHERLSMRAAIQSVLTGRSALSEGGKTDV